MSKPLTVIKMKVDSLRPGNSPSPFGAGAVEFPPSEGRTHKSQVANTLLPHTVAIDPAKVSTCINNPLESVKLPFETLMLLNCSSNYE
jgi:hypothetical protein